MGRLTVKWGRWTLSHTVFTAPPQKVNGQFKTQVCAMKEKKKVLWEYTAKGRGRVCVGKNSLKVILELKEA